MIGKGAEHQKQYSVEPQTNVDGEVQGRSKKQRITVFLLISVVNVALCIFFVTQLLTPAHVSNNLKATNGGKSLSGDINSPLIGKAAPDFTLSLLTPRGNSGGKTLHLSAFKGKAIILNFWASWCDPCNQEAPLLQRAWPGMEKQGIVLIGIDGGDKADSAQQFLQKYGITYRNVQDTIGETTATDYGVTGLPQSVFINKQGIVVAKWIYPLTRQGLQLEMAKLAH